MIPALSKQLSLQAQDASETQSAEEFQEALLPDCLQGSWEFPLMLIPNDNDGNSQTILMRSPLHQIVDILRGCFRIDDQTYLEPVLICRFGSRPLWCASVPRPGLLCDSHGAILTR